MRDTISIRPVEGRAAIRDWLAVPRRVFAGDPAWIAPLDIAERQRISKKAPIRGFGEVALFLACRNGVPVGRISAQVNRRHLAQQNDATGHFGFFDCIDDQTVADALLNAAAGWLKARGMAHMAGPYNFSTNEECGLLVENFTDPPVVMMPHARRFAGALLERAGLEKEMDLYSYRCMPAALPRLERLAMLARRMPALRLRPLNLKQYAAEVALLVDIFNDSWRGNWGFVPFGAEEARHMASEMRPVLRPEYGRVLESGGEPVGIMVAIPDINGMTADFGGKLLPFNWAKLIWRLKRERAEGGRVLLLGLKQSLQASPQAGALLAMLAMDLLRQKDRYRALRWMDFGWILETNVRMNRFAAAIAGPPYRTHRLYAKAI